MREILLAATILVSAIGGHPLLAKPAVAPPIRLTSAEGNTAPGCTLSLDQRKDISPERRPDLIVGGMNEYDDHGQWHLGINGTVYEFPFHSFSGNAEIMMNKNKTIHTSLKSLKILSENQSSGFPFQTRKMSLTIAIRRTIKTFIVFQACAME